MQHPVHIGNLIQMQWWRTPPQRVKYPIEKIGFDFMIITLKA